MESLLKTVKRPKDPVKKLFNDYCQQRTSNKQSINGLEFKTFKQNILKQAKQLKTKAAGRKIAFKVVTENGQTKIKALLKK